MGQMGRCFLLPILCCESRNRHGDVEKALVDQRCRFGVAFKRQKFVVVMLNLSRRVALKMWFESSQIDALESPTSLSVLFPVESRVEIESRRHKN